MSANSVTSAPRHIYTAKGHLDSSQPKSVKTLEPRSVLVRHGVAECSARTCTGCGDGAVVYPGRRGGGYRVGIGGGYMVGVYGCYLPLFASIYASYAAIYASYAAIYARLRQITPD